MTTGNKAPVTVWLLRATGLKHIKNMHFFRAKTSILHCRAGSVPGAGGWIFCKGSRFSQPLQSSSSGSLSSLQERLQGLSADTSSLLVSMKIYHTFSSQCSLAILWHVCIVVKPSPLGWHLVPRCKNPALQQLLGCTHHTHHRGTPHLGKDTQKGWLRRETAFIFQLQE